MKLVRFPMCEYALTSQGRKDGSVESPVPCGFLTTLSYSCRRSQFMTQVVPNCLTDEQIASTLLFAGCWNSHTRGAAPFKAPWQTDRAKDPGSWNCCVAVLRVVQEFAKQQAFERASTRCAA